MGLYGIYGIEIELIFMFIAVVHLLSFTINLHLTMDYNTTITSLFFLLIYADGDISEKELERGKQMMKAEGIDETKFNTIIEKLKNTNHDLIYADCLKGLKKLDKDKQIRCIAWLCVVANSDGFMDKKEWMLIYKIYHTELNLQLDDIMKVQKQLNSFIHGKAFHSLGVYMNKPGSE